MLGPALGPGVVIAYDMPWAPEPGLTPFALGIGTPAPRAVPGDAVIAAVGWVLGAGVGQSLILCALLVGTGVGAALLLQRIRPLTGRWALAATAVAATWSPFVIERLAIGQWVILLGHAVIPWALAAAWTWGRAEEPGRAATGCATLLGLIALASLGGANPLVMLAFVLLPVLAALRIRARDWLWVLGTFCGAAAVWALPAAVGGVVGAPEGAQAFAPRADTPLGVLLSLISGGGFWNVASHPAPRGHLVVALVTTLLAAVCAAVVVTMLWRRARPILGALVVPWTVLLLSCSMIVQPLWAHLTQVPGGGLLRDSQKFLSVWALLLALGLGRVVDGVLGARRRELVPPAAIALTLLPIALLPTALWGLGGRLDAVHVPSGLRDGVAVLNRAPQGLVGVLPWNQYRRYAWNGNRISLTLLPRMVDQVTLFDDSLPLDHAVVPGEDPRSARVSAAIAAGGDPVDALAKEGTAYIAMERRAGLPTEELADRGRVLVDTPELLVISLNGNPTAATMSSVQRTGWVLTLATWLLIGTNVARVTWQSLRNRQIPLLRSRP